MAATADKHLEPSRVMKPEKERLLRAVAIYGANASGKSNIIEAMQVMRDFVLFSGTEGQVEYKIPVEPFRLRDDTIDAPSDFEWEFVIKEIRYRYGFEADRVKIHSEWLMRRRPSAKEAVLFTREAQQIEPNPEQFKEGVERKKFARENALFLSVCAQLNGELSKEILSWFNRSKFISSLSTRTDLAFTAEWLKNPRHAKILSSVVQRADLGISGLSSEVEAWSEEQLPKSLAPSTRRRILTQMRRVKIKTKHVRYDPAGEEVGTEVFDMEEDESDGTLRFVAIFGLIFDMIEKGGLLVIDEFEARLHPLLTQQLFDYFHVASKESECQFIIATHDVLLMDPEAMRRDQVYFCQKEAQGGTKLYSLAEFDPEAVRPTTKFSRQYLLGVFGAIPRLALDQETAANG